MKKRYRYSLIIVIILLVLTTSIGSTYSLWSFRYEQDWGSNIVAAPSCFEITIDSYEDLSLYNTYPMSDAEGILTQPYLASVTNNCSVDMPFKMVIEESTNDFSDGDIRVNLAGDYTVATSDLSDYYDSELGYVIVSDTIDYGETATFTLRMWVKNGTYGSSTTSDGTVITGTNITDKSFNGTVKFIAASNF